MKSWQEVCQEGVNTHHNFLTSLVTQVRLTHTTGGIYSIWKSNVWPASVGLAQAHPSNRHCFKLGFKSTLTRMTIIATLHSGTMVQDVETDLLVCTEIKEVVCLTLSLRQFLHNSIMYRAILRGKNYYKSLVQSTEYAFSFNFTQCRDLVRKLTNLYKKGMLLIGLLLAWGVWQTSMYSILKNCFPSQNDSIAKMWWCEYTPTFQSWL